MLHCLCKCRIHEQNSESITFHESSSYFLSEVSRFTTRNKAKNALSLAVPISPGMAGAKIEKISFGWREKKEIFHKSAENTVSIWRILVILQ